jgi:hypothetical protein
MPPSEPAATHLRIGQKLSKLWGPLQYTSRLGAFLADTSVAGRADFGFVSRYQKGANVLTGNTEFRFKARNLNFKSSSYEWLVVQDAAGRAQFKGTGTINGTGNLRIIVDFVRCPG